MYAYPRTLLIVLALTATAARAHATCLNTELATTGSGMVLDRCTAPEPPDGRVTAQQLDTMTQWITERFGLARPTERPSIVFESPGRLARLHGFENVETFRMSDRMRRPDLLAIYSDTKRAIYLSDDWTGTTQAQMSVLVHALVHHMQNASSLRYTCRGERAILAFQAQAAWLEQSGTSLESEFGLNLPSVITQGNCM